MPDNNEPNQPIKRDVNQLPYEMPSAGITHIKLPGSKQRTILVVSLTDAVNHPIKLTNPSLGVVS